jgi:mannose-6-phosphate isomerase-like protein (cupin superfamily)
MAKPKKPYSVVKLSQTKDSYAGTEVPGEFRRFTDLLGGEQLAMTLIHIPAHCDFEQGTGHYHDEIEELYIITRGTLTMRFDDKIQKVSAPAAVLVKPKTKRSHRNEGEEPVDMWAISPKLGRDDSHLIKIFWEASEQAAQKR